MFVMEQEFTEAEALLFIQEAVHDPENKQLREEIIDPVISVLEKASNRNKYIGYGSEFLSANAEMLSKEYPTKAVSYPRRYVDSVLAMFDFTVESLKKKLKVILKNISDKTNFNSIIANPTNVIHTVVLFYSDMIGHRQLRDSARQQMALSIYGVMFTKFFPAGVNEGIMAYTYMNLDNSWGIVKSENMINWLGDTLETAYQFWRTKLTMDMSPNVLVQFLNRVRTSFNQNMRGLANKYHENRDKGNLIGADLQGNEDYVVTTDTSVIRDNLIRLIKNKDELYYKKGDLYPAIGRLKNVKVDALFEYSTKKIVHGDIAIIIDLILYVFINKEGNKIEDINSTKYISRITNFPTAIDRAIPGKPIVLPFSKKYKEDSSIVKSHICLVATYILNRINQVRN